MSSGAKRVKRNPIYLMRDGDSDGDGDGSSDDADVIDLTCESPEKKHSAHAPPSPVRPPHSPQPILPLASKLAPAANPPAAAAAGGGARPLAIDWARYSALVASTSTASASSSSSSEAAAAESFAGSGGSGSGRAMRAPKPKNPKQPKPSKRAAAAAAAAAEAVATAAAVPPSINPYVASAWPELAAYAAAGGLSAPAAPVVKPEPIAVSSSSAAAAAGGAIGSPVFQWSASGFARVLADAMKQLFSPPRALPPPPLPPPPPPPSRPARPAMDPRLTRLLSEKSEIENKIVRLTAEKVKKQTELEQLRVSEPAAPTDSGAGAGVSDASTEAARLNHFKLTKRASAAYRSSEDVLKFQRSELERVMRDITALSNAGANGIAAAAAALAPYSGTAAAASSSSSSSGSSTSGGGGGNVEDSEFDPPSLGPALSGPYAFARGAKRVKRKKINHELDIGRIASDSTAAVHASDDGTKKLKHETGATAAGGAAGGGGGGGDENNELVPAALFDGSSDKKLVPIDTPTDMHGIELFPHQRLGVAWMMKTEQSTTRGGLLADQPGMGKTIQCIALMLKNRSFTKDRKTTLVVAPLAVIAQWENEIQLKTKPRALTTLKYHSLPERQKNAAFLIAHDVIITTYATLAAEAPSAKKKKSKGPLFQISWFRVILDESHSVKNRHTRAAVACSELISTRRWALTGTPIQNNLDELFSLFKYLRLKPYSVLSEFRRLTNPLKRGKPDESSMAELRRVLVSIMLRRDKASALQLPERKVDLIQDSFSLGEADIYAALEKSSVIKFNEYLRKGTVMQNYSNILVLLLRLRQCCNHPLMVPDARSSRAIAPPRPEDDPTDEELAAAIVGDGAAAAAAGGNGAEIDTKSAEEDLGLLPDPVLSRLIGVIEQVQSRSWECAVCLDVIDDAAHTPCFHIFCRTCLLDTLNRQPVEERNCPLCRASVALDQVMSTEQLKQKESGRFAAEEKRVAAVNRRAEAASAAAAERARKDAALAAAIEAKAGSAAAAAAGGGGGTSDTPSESREPLSTKMQTLIRLLSETRSANAKTKTVVFSQWTQFLNRLEPAMKANNFVFERYDGSMSITERERRLENFKSNPQVIVLLASLKCCGLGLNLTAASRVVLCDVWWNPCMEEQAIDRVHRIGQKEGVQVSRLTIKDTVEDRIILLQEYKRRLANAALFEGKFSFHGLSEKDLIALFKPHSGSAAAAASAAASASSSSSAAAAASASSSSTAASFTPL